jgi:RNA 3'-terminal phosphate cyclase (ATP)
LLAEVESGATVDRFAADQIVPFAALAAGDTSFRVMSVTEHLRTAAWLASLFLEVEVELSDGRVVIHGSGRRTLGDSDKGDSRR